MLNCRFCETESSDTPDTRRSFELISGAMRLMRCSTRKRVRYRGESKNCSILDLFHRQPVMRMLASFHNNRAASDNDAFECLQSLVLARRNTLGDRPFATLSTLEDYGRATHGALLRYTLHVLKR